MRHVLGVAVVVVAFSSCTFGARTCKVDSDCGSDGACESGFCYVLDSGSTGGGGGVVVGGGGGTTGGGGGVTGGGTGGGPSCQNASNCPPYEECAPDLSGGTCVSQGLVITWVTPAMNASFNTATTAGALTITKADGGAVTLTMVPVTGATADFTGAGGSYSGTLSLSGADGMKSFVAGWASPGPSRTLTLEKDTVPPDVNIVVEARPLALGDGEPSFETFWKKDEVATIRVTVDGGRPAQISDVVVPWGGAVTAATCSGTCSGACQCFGIELAGSSVAGMRGSDSVRIQAIADLAGNSSSVQDAGIAITRFKWARPVTLTASSALLPVAVSQQGVVIWGGQDAPVTSPRVFAVAQDGGSLWGSVAAGTITAGPVSGANDVWVATEDAVTSQLRRFSLAAGASTGTECIATLGTAGLFAGDLGLSTVGGVEIPVGVRNAEVQGPAGGNCRTQPLTAFPTSAGARPTVIVQTDGGSTEVFVASTGAAQLWKAKLEGTTFSAMGDSPLPASTQPRGLFHDGAQRVGGSGVAGTGSVFTTPSSGNITGASFTQIPAMNSGPAAVGNGFMLYGTSTGSLAKVAYTSSTGAMADGGVLPVTGAVSLQDRTPVLGAGAMVYVIGDSGLLSVRRQSDLSEVWSASIASGATVISQPALDLYRAAAGAKDCNRPLGVLYVSSRVGSTATLRAILVDSKGLDSSAPWPKYQRDNANTGNSSASLAHWTCP